MKRFFYAFKRIEALRCILYAAISVFYSEFSNKKGEKTPFEFLKFFRNLPCETKVRERMLKKFNFLEFCWLATVILLTSTVITIFTNADISTETVAPARTLFGIDLTYCIVIFYAFNTFLFFGIKEFFWRYERKFPNTIIMFSGAILTISLLILNII